MSPGQGAAPALWGGRFQDGPDPLFRAINDSLPVDWRLVRQDIAGSVAWAEGLARAGVLSADELAATKAGLATLWQRARDLPAPPIESGAEDVHTWVESELTALLEPEHGSLGKKLHTGRSRNDQVATDLRLWTLEALAERLAELRALAQSLVALAERSAGVVMPAYTHLQPAQPVLAGHWCLAYVEMLERDAERLRSAAEIADSCPLGSAALAGTTYAVDRQKLAERLGFTKITRNSLDAVSDRDFVVDALSAAAVCGVHLSRLAEELVIYASAEFGMVELEDAVTSGSSLMPQKKNPDALELVRGKAGGLLAGFQTMCVVLKGTPLAYNKDLQEDKATLFASMDTLSLVLRAAERVIDGIRFVPDRCRTSALRGGSNATELADHLVARGVPFRESHDIVGRAVRAAQEDGSSLEDWPPERFKTIDPRFGDDAPAWLTVDRLLQRREIEGGTGPNAVSAALAAAGERLEGLAGPAVAPIVRDPSGE
ncbi:MAG: argininosuccinate lyase [Planctomycetota bacterium]